jgi:hypothetical protein
MLRRREFVAAAAGAMAARAAGRPTIMLRSGWQTVNIGDITHSPGVLAVFEKHIPEADLVWWPVSADRGVEPMVQRRFPKLRIVKGAADAAEVKDALASASVLVHGSAAGMSARPDFEAWRKASKKPYGFFGVGFSIGGEAASTAASAEVLSLASGAAFFFTRETASLANLKTAGVKGPEMGFAPDGTFSVDLLDEERAVAYLKANGLEPGKFICAIPRLRYTPYHRFRAVTLTKEEIARRDAVNERHAEEDHAKMREAIVAWVRKTGGKALLCPEMTYELDEIGRLLYDPLPADVKRNAVKRTTFWLPDEASSVYKRAAIVVSAECHSPIMAVAHGTPCIYVHQPEDGIKGHMWQDVGLGDWRFEVEKTTGAAIAERVLAIQAAGEASRRKAREAAAYAQKVQGERAGLVRRLVAQ